MSQFFRFVLVGIANTVLGYAIIFGLMYLAEFSPEISNLSGYFFGLLISYVLNRNFTFESIQRRDVEFLRFIIVFAVAYLANLMVLIFLVRVVFFSPGWAQVVSGGVYIVLSYFLNKYYVFRSRKNI